MVRLSRATPSLLEVATARGGIVKGARAASIVVSWAIAQEACGHELGGGELTAAIREYKDYWRQSERTAWNELRRFRDVFPDEQSPARFAEAILQATTERSEARLASAPLLIAA